MQAVQLLSVCLLVLPLYASAQVVEVTSPTDLLLDRKPLFVMFYSPTCKHCKAAAPQWQKLASITEVSEQVTVARVNCMEESLKEICTQFEVKAYPTILLILPPDSTRKPYTGVRNVHSYLVFLVANAQSDEQPVSFSDEVMLQAEYDSKGYDEVYRAFHENKRTGGGGEPLETSQLLINGGISLAVFAGILYYLGCFTPRATTRAAGRTASGTAAASGAAGEGPDRIVSDLCVSRPVVIWSKTWCPYCTRAKELFTQLHARFLAVELDTRPDGDELEAALQRATGLDTVPNIFIGGKCIGGSLDLDDLHTSGQLVPMLRRAQAL